MKSASRSFPRLYSTWLRYLLFAWRSGRFARSHQRLPHLRTLRRNHAAGRQRLRIAASPNRRMLGADPSSGDDAWGAHVDFLFSRPALLGQAQTHAGSAPRRLVGCKQDRAASPPPIETSRGWLVFYHGVRHTPSGCLYRLGLALFELENPAKVPAARRLLDFWTRGRVRAPRRRRRCCVPVRIHDGCRRRHAQYLLRSRGLFRSPCRQRACASLEWLDTNGKLRTKAARPGFYDVAWGCVRIYLWPPAPSPEPRLHHQAPYLPGLLRLRARVRLARCPHARNVCATWRSDCQPSGTPECWPEFVGRRRPFSPCSVL